MTLTDLLFSEIELMKAYVRNNSSRECFRYGKDEGSYYIRYEDSKHCEKGEFMTYNSENIVQFRKQLELCLGGAYDASDIIISAIEKKDLIKNETSKELDLHNYMM